MDRAGESDRRLEPCGGEIRPAAESGRGENRPPANSGRGDIDLLAESDGEGETDEG